MKKFQESSRQEVNNARTQSQRDKAFTNHSSNLGERSKAVDKMTKDSLRGRLMI